MEPAFDALGLGHSALPSDATDSLHVAVPELHSYVERAIPSHVETDSDEPICCSEVKILLCSERDPQKASALVCPDFARSDEHVRVVVVAVCRVITRVFVSERNRALVDEHANGRDKQQQTRLHNPRS
jgi:hypothetical protein